MKTEKKEWIVTRTGSNSANQSMTQELRVARVLAHDEEEACDLAGHRVTVYPNQSLYAELAAEIDAEEEAIDEAVTVL